MYGRLISHALRGNASLQLPSSYQRSFAAGIRKVVQTAMPPHPFTNEIKKCGSNWEKATAVLDKILRYEKEAKPMHKVSMINEVIALCIKSRQFDKALNLFFSIELEHNLEPDIDSYNHAMDIYGKTGKPHKTLELLEVLESVSDQVFKPDSVSYSIAIKACAEVGDAACAANLLGRMEKIVGVKPSVVTYSSAISVCAKVGDYQQALELLSLMEKNGLSPNEITLRSVIRACTNAKQPNKAFEILHTMMDRYSIAPPLGVIASIMYALTRSSESFSISSEHMVSHSPGFGMADYIREEREHLVEICDKVLVLFQLFERLDYEVGPRIYNTVIGAYGRCGRWEEALDLFNSMAENPSLKMDIVSYNALMNALGSSGQWEKAEELFYSIQENKIKALQPDVISVNTLLLAYVIGQQYEKAEILFNSMTSELKLKPDRYSFNPMIQAHCLNGELEKAVALFHQTQSLGQMHISSINHLIGAFSRHDQYERALELFDSVPSFKGMTRDVRTYNRMLSAHARSGQVERLEACMRQMELDTNTNSPYNPFTFNAILQGFFDAEAWDSVVVWFDKMIAATFPEDTSGDSSHLGDKELEIEDIEATTVEPKDARQLEAGVSSSLKIIPRYSSCLMMMEALKQLNRTDRLDEVSTLMEKYQIMPTGTEIVVEK